MRKPAAAIFCLAALASCAPPAPRGPDAPAGLVVVADGAAARRLLERLAKWERTPLAALAHAASTRVSSCGRVAAVAPDGSVPALLARLACSTGVPGMPTIGPGGLAVALPARGGARGIGAGTVDDAGGVMLRLRGPAGAEVFDALTAAGGPAPAPRLSDAGALFAAHWKSDDPGILGRFVGGFLGVDGTVASTTARAVLDGRFELAVYGPEAGDDFPPAVIAVGARSMAAARRLLDEGLARLASESHIRPVAVEIGGRAGRCFPSLKLVTRFAPCFVLDDAGLVVAWNRAAFEHALTPRTTPSPPSSNIRIDLAALPSADAVFAGRAAVAAAPAAAAPPWASLAVTGERDGDDAVLTIELEAKSP